MPAQTNQMTVASVRDIITATHQARVQVVWLFRHRVVVHLQRSQGGERRQGLQAAVAQPFKDTARVRVRVGVRPFHSVMAGMRAVFEVVGFG